ncbi:MAG: type II secretion system protein GspG [Spirochaetia bacterium]|nr:type II secretion system protein GspG [Spirochaetia bacterium]
MQLFFLCSAFAGLTAFFLWALKPPDVIVDHYSPELRLAMDAHLIIFELARYEEQIAPMPEGASIAPIVRRTPKSLARREILDPWGRPYFICSPRRINQTVCSFGRDGTPGGTGADSDIVLDDYLNRWPH